MDGWLRSKTRAIDRRWLRLTDAGMAGLNWKGRTIERAHALRSRLTLARPIAAPPPAPPPSPPSQPSPPAQPSPARPSPAPSGLNWKGRLIERSHATARSVRRLSRDQLYGRAFRAANEVMFRIYRAANRLKPKRTHVTSVLQLSILSHKPFMLSRSMRAAGLKSDYFALNVTDEAILSMGWDYALRMNVPPVRRRLLEFYYLWTVLARYDVIHSHFKSFLSADGWELEYLQRLGKVLVFHSRGCDVRHRSRNMMLQPELNCCQECDYPIGSCDTDYQRQQVGIMMRHGNLFFVTTPDLRDFVPGSEHIPFIHPVGVDFEAIQPAPRSAETFRVVTSSNHHGIDGTRFIRDAVARLRSEGRDIELIEVNQMPYREALSIYKSADVYVGKLRMGYYNNANIETMMLGVPNMSYIREEFRSIAPDCPIIVTRPETVYERLHYYLDHRDELRAIGARGPAFARAHHDPAALARLMIDRYNEAFRALTTGAGTPPPTHPVTFIRKDVTT